MARNVFFSFHYDNDVQRAFVVRQSWVTKPNRTASGVIDRADFGYLKGIWKTTTEKRIIYNIG